MAQNSLTPNPNSNPNPDVEKIRYENFGEYFSKWLIEQEKDLRELAAFSRVYNRSPHESELIQAAKEAADRVLSHYEHYYKVKRESTPGYVYQMLSPSWCSTMEEAYLWIGGWRPTTAFHVLYSKTGLQFEARFTELLDGMDTHDLGAVSAYQIAIIDQMQRETIDAERVLTEKWAECQESVGDTPMVALSNAMSESPMPQLMNEQLASVLSPKEVGFEELLKEADELRLTTLKRLVHVLTPIQTVHFFISTAQLHLQLHDWGKKKDVEIAQAQAQDQTVPTIAGPSRTGPTFGPSRP